MSTMSHEDALGSELLHTNDGVANLFSDLASVSLPRDSPAVQTDEADDQRPTKDRRAAARRR